VFHTLDKSLAFWFARLIQKYPVLFLNIWISDRQQIFNELLARFLNANILGMLQLSLFYLNLLDSL